jgi:hypothetical protein
MDLERPTIDLPFSVHVYDGGYLGLAPDTLYVPLTRPPPSMFKLIVENDILGSVTGSLII